MELNNLIGYRLTEIQKIPNLTKLVFSKRGIREKLELTFKNGLLFETLTPVTNKKVTRVNLKTVLGFKAITELRNQGLNPNDFQQLLLEMEGSTSDYKVELICVFKQHTFRRRN